MRKCQSAINTQSMSVSSARVRVRLRSGSALSLSLRLFSSHYYALSNMLDVDLSCSVFWHVQIADSLRSGSLSAPELCEACLRRLNKTRELNAFITVLPESALQSAEAAQQRITKGIFVNFMSSCYSSFLAQLAQLVIYWCSRSQLPVCLCVCVC